MDVLDIDLKKESKKKKIKKKKKKRIDCAFGFILFDFLKKPEWRILVDALYLVNSSVGQIVPMVVIIKRGLEPQR